MAFTDPSFGLQQAIMDKLKAAPAVAALVADRIFDRIPNVPTFPYVSFGNTEVNPVSAEGIDAADCFITLHTWDRFKGFDKTKMLGPQVINTLHDEPLAIGEGGVKSLLLDSVNYIRDPDGLTSHGILTFSVLTDANGTS